MPVHGFRAHVFKSSYCTFSSSHTVIRLGKVVPRRLRRGGPEVLVAGVAEAVTQHVPDQDDIRQRYITNRIKDAESLKDLVLVYKKYSRELNHIHISAVINHLAQLWVRGEVKKDEKAALDDFVLQWLEVALPQLGRLDHQGVANTLYAMARINARGSRFDPVIQRLVELVGPALGQCQPRWLCNIVWSLAHLKQPVNPEWMEEFYTATVTRLSSFTPQGLVNMLYGVVKLEAVPDPHWLGAFWAVAKARMGELPAYELTSLVQSLSELKQRPDIDWQVEVLPFAQNKMKEFDAQSLVGLGIALADIQVVPDPTWLNDYFKAVDTHLDSLDPDLVPGLLQISGLWKMEQSPSWWAAFYQRTRDKVPKMSATAVASTMYNLAKHHQECPHDYRQALFDRSMESFDQFNTVDFAQCIHGASRERQAPSIPWLESFAQASMKQLPSFEPQQLANVIYSLAKVAATTNWQPSEQWSRAFFASSQLQLGQLTEQGVALMIHGLARMNWRDRMEECWVEEYWKVLGNIVDSSSGRGLSTISWSLAKLGVMPTGELFDRLCNRIEQVGPELSAQDACALLVTVMTVGVPKAEVLSVLMQSVVKGWGKLTAPQKEMLEKWELLQPYLKAAGLLTPPLAQPPTLPSWAGRASLGEEPSTSASSSSRGAVAEIAETVRKLATKRKAEELIGELLVNSSHRLQSASPAELGDLLSAVADSRVRVPSRWTKEFYEVTYRRLAWYSPDQYATILDAIARLGLRPPKSWTAQLLKDCERQLSAASGSALCTIIQALADLNVQPRSSWQTLYVTCCQPLLPSLTAHQLAVLVWSLAEVGCRLEQDWLKAYVQAATNQVVSLDIGDTAQMNDGLRYFLDFDKSNPHLRGLIQRLKARRLELEQQGSL